MKQKKKAYSNIIVTKIHFETVVCVFFFFFCFQASTTFQLITRFLFQNKARWWLRKFTQNISFDFSGRYFSYNIIKKTGKKEKKKIKNPLELFSTRLDLLIKSKTTKFGKWAFLSCLALRFSLLLLYLFFIIFFLSYGRITPVWIYSRGPIRCYIHVRVFITLRLRLRRSEHILFVIHYILYHLVYRWKSTNIGRFVCPYLHIMVSVSNWLIDGARWF